MNNDIIVCGFDNFFSEDSSLCERGIYCINELYGINSSYQDYHCFSKCKEDLNNTNYTCPYYISEKNELNNDNIYNCSMDNYIPKCNNINNNDDIEKIISTDILENQCYFTCKSCDIYGDEINHNCIECKDNYKFELNISLYKNCYNNCTYFYYIDIYTQKYYCTKDKKCPDDYNKLIPNKNQCINNCSLYDDYKYEYNYICLNQYPSDLSSFIFFICNNTIDNKDNFFGCMKNELLKLCNITDINQGNDLEIYLDNFLLTITNTFNQNKNEKLNTNKTTINLAECETKLKSFYNISINDSLYIFKFDKKIEGMKIPKIEYEVYYPLYTNELFQLNLSICENTKIDISIPIILNDSLDKYDSNSDYYNNLCSKATSESGTDISLTDRKNEFIENNMTICEENCELKNYDYSIKKVKCSCEIKLKIPYFDKIHFDKKELLKKFIDINNIGNLKIIKCIKDIFSKDFIKNNYGFFFFLIILILYFICLFSFYFKFYDTLVNQIKEIAYSRKMIFSKNSHITNNIKSDNFPPKKKSKKKKIKFKNLNNYENVNNKAKLPLSKNKKILRFNDTELNSMKYKNAIIYDKRTFIQYYISLLKKYNLLIFSFYCQKDDYNPQIIKIFLFFFFFSAHFTSNALFFDDSTMHTIYKEEGKYNFIYQIPQIFYSSLISYIVNPLILYLSLPEKDIIKLKGKKNNKNINDKINKTFRIIKIKFALFFIVSFIFLLAFACYIICFCGIYTNTQIHLTKDTLVSFILSLIYPFGTNLIPAFFRIYALRAKGNDKSYIYSISQFIEDL